MQKETIIQGMLMCLSYLEHLCLDLLLSTNDLQCALMLMECTLGMSHYNFPGNERRQELFMTQALESD